MTDVKAVQGNAVKYERYRHAHERLKLALDHGFYIEASMICESIMADRMHSHLHWRHVNGLLDTGAWADTLLDKLRFNDVVGFSPLAKMIRHDFDPLGQEKYERLPHRILGWAQDRNRIAHGYVFTFPEHKTYREDYTQFCLIAQRCGETGAQLARLITDWDRSMRTRLPKMVGRAKPSP